LTAPTAATYDENDPAPAFSRGHRRNRASMPRP